ncbi:hypothetical protein M407DRAFT_4824 [Tulasnella calospora MUT 4182]|uniref:Raptor N-terminal CASPase-like domain-containing protein n=1 Tax=Tulasnella calospora MUT 4182 TaxID=1051891 RepID=A0A0C3QSJ7_9AGAM|nr:hypothetical protein M407DRAFT_4824 [Tulasnella calospora MUT 4182]
MPPTRAISEDAQSREDATRTLEPPTKKARLSAEPAGGLPSTDQTSILGSSNQEPPPDEDEWKDEVLAEPEDDVDRRSDLYLDTVNRMTLDFDFEKLCSVSLSNINVYGCLVCGKYFQGRGKSSYAYAHSIHEDHHVFINLETQKVYVLPDGYEVHDPSLDDISAVLSPTFTKGQVDALSSPSYVHRHSYDLSSKAYYPGFVGLNNIKRNDYLNVIIHALVHVPPLRDYLLLFKPSKPTATVATPSEPTAGGKKIKRGPPVTSSELLNRFAALAKKLWNPRLFKSQVSPHEFLQEVTRSSAGKFKITEQGDPVEFLGWLLNKLHSDMGGSRRKDSNFKTMQSHFLFLAVDLPPPPLFQDAVEKNIIPQVTLASVLAKYDGKTVQENGGELRRYKCQRLPPYIILHYKRFTKNVFVEEKNPTIVNFPIQGVDFSPYVDTNEPSASTVYDLIANVVHESTAGTARDKSNTAWKVQLRAGKISGGLGEESDLGDQDEKWFQIQDLIVEELQKEMIFLGETVLQLLKILRSTRFRVLVMATYGSRGSSLALDRDPDQSGFDLNTNAGEYKPRVDIEWWWQRMMSDGYNDHPDGHAQWRVDSPRSSSSRTASSRLPSSSAYDEEDGESLIAIPPNLPAWNIKRHITAGNPTPKPDSVKNLGPWRGKDNKHKTSQAILVICLNIGVDPPDIVKTNPCAVLECWIDPFSLPPSKALEAIGKNLVHQFETLNPRMKYKHYPDPSVDDTRKFCMTLRKLAKEERALFYYNGHGVPKPTASGEIWVFNRGYTQYIPVSLHDLQGWLGCPTIYVWDCSAAGHIIENFEKFAKRRDEEFYQQHPDPASQANYSPYLDCVHLAACAADETLPMCPDLPADVFTSALTSPIEMALRFYVLQNQHRLSVTIEDAMKIPGDLKDRRTPLGELNWIFTAITDTIAWTAFPKDLFKRFFRQDWTLAALSRNFLLAERIMRKYNCTPRTYPALPPAHMHPLWQSWDLAVDKPDTILNIPNELEHRAMCGFIMAMECRDHPGGQQAALDQNFLQSCASGLESADYLMRQWSALGMALLWDRFDYGKSYAVGTLSLPDLLLSFIMDDAAEVRAAIFFALSTLYGASASSDPHRRGGDGTGSMLHLNERDHLGFELKTGVEAILTGKDDASPIVRKEVVVLFSAIVHEWRGWFVIAAWAYWEGSRSDFNDLRHQLHLISTRNTNNRASIATTASGESSRTGRGAEGDPEVVWNGIEEFIERAPDEDSKSHNHTVLSSVFILYAALLDLTVDPYPEVANMAKTIADYITALLRESYFARLPASTIDSIPTSDIPQPQGTSSRSSAQARGGSALQPGRDGPNRNSLNLTESTLSTTIKRTSSIANSIRNLAAGYAFPTVADKGHPEGDEEEAEPRPSRQSVRGIALDAHPPRFEFKAAVPQPRFNFTAYLSPYPSRTADRNRTTPAASGGSLRSVRGGTQERQGASGSPASAPSTPKKPGGFYVPSSGRQTPSSTTGTSSPELSASSVGYTAADVIAALIEEDWERLRLRRLAGSRDQQQRQQRNQAMMQQQQLQNGQQQGQLQVSLSHLAQQQPAQTNVFRQSQNAAGAQSQGRSSAQLAVGQHANGRGPLSTENVRNAQNLSANGMQGSWMSDSSSSFVTTDSEGSGSHLALGLGSTTGVANILPLKSKYFDWSMEYFTEPQMRAAEDEEPGSVVFNEQSWRGQRNDRILVETQKQGLTANRCPWDKSLMTIQNSHPVRLLKFHQFETHLITVNNDRLVSVWDWAKKKRLACFDNGNPEGTSVTSLHFVNEETQALILTASADGMVKVFNNYDPDMAFDDYPIEMCSSFRALPRLSMSEHRSGVVTDWLQPYGLLVVGGDSKTIKIWDAHKETIATVSSDIPSENCSCVTSIAADLDGAATVVASFGDGSLGVYDRRSSRVQIRTRIYDKHSSWIQSVHWQRGSQREILSGSLDGKVILWDIRSVGGSVVEWEPFQGGLANFAVHDRTGVFAASSAIGRGVVRQQNIQVHSLPPRPHPPMKSEIKIPITSAQFQPSWQPSFFPSPGSLAFHPHEMMLGWGGYDGRIKIFGADLKRQIPSLDLPYDEVDGLEEFPPPPASVQTLEGRISPG